MNSRQRKFLAASVVWVFGCLFAVRLVAGMLCSSTRSYTDKAGVYNVMVTVAEPEIIWNLVLSPGFAIPAMVFLFAGWVFLWRIVR